MSGFLGGLCSKNEIISGENELLGKGWERAQTRQSLRHDSKTAPSSEDILKQFFFKTLLKVVPFPCLPTAQSWRVDHVGQGFNSLITELNHRSSADAIRSKEELNQQGERG